MANRSGRSFLIGKNPRPPLPGSIRRAGMRRAVPGSAAEGDALPPQTSDAAHVAKRLGTLLNQGPRGRKASYCGMAGTGPCPPSGFCWRNPRGRCGPCSILYPAGTLNKSAAGSPSLMLVS